MSKKTGDHPCPSTGGELGCFAMQKVGCFISFLRSKSHNSPPVEGCPKGGVVSKYIPCIAIKFLFLLCVLRVISVFFVVRIYHRGHKGYTKFTKKKHRFMPCRSITKHIVPNRAGRKKRDSESSSLSPPSHSHRRKHTTVFGKLFFTSKERTGRN